jgi:hypothetical protein
VQLHGPKLLEKLRLNLTGADQTQLAKTYTESGEAYEAYLKGRYHWNKRTDEGFKQATNFFQEAIAKDPNYALAYTGLADCYTLRSDYGFLAPKEGYALAKGAVTLALQYDESLAEAHTSLAELFAWIVQGSDLADSANTRRLAGLGIAVMIACAQCGAAVSRVPDVGNVWLDGGIVPMTELLTSYIVMSGTFPISLVRHFDCGLYNFFSGCCGWGSSGLGLATTSDQNNGQQDDGSENC